ncbi:hypothetical protein AN958_10469 [Leucoagaricus sp. SymC.cos]|nr:hypothetical protein AN958_10469 [Leucoagaricus sp. SymC.cos]
MDGTTALGVGCFYNFGYLLASSPLLPLTSPKQTTSDSLSHPQSVTRPLSPHAHLTRSHSHTLSLPCSHTTLDYVLWLDCLSNETFEECFGGRPPVRVRVHREGGEERVLEILG